MVNRKLKELFERYVDDIICAINGEPDILHRKVNTLHRKLHTLHKNISPSKVNTLHKNINVNSFGENNCEWYKKPTDTGVVLKFHSCAPIQHYKNIVEGTVHRVFRSTSKILTKSSEGKWKYLAQRSISWRLDFQNNQR